MPAPPHKTPMPPDLSEGPHSAELDALLELGARVVAEHNRRIREGSNEAATPMPPRPAAFEESLMGVIRSIAEAKRDREDKLAAERGAAALGPVGVGVLPLTAPREITVTSISASNTKRKRKGEHRHGTGT